MSVFYTRPKPGDNGFFLTDQALEAGEYAWINLGNADDTTSFTWEVNMQYAYGSLLLRPDQSIRVHSTLAHPISIKSFLQMEDSSLYGDDEWRWRDVCNYILYAKTQRTLSFSCCKRGKLLSFQVCTLCPLMIYLVIDGWQAHIWSKKDRLLPLRLQLMWACTLAHLFCRS